MVWRHKVLFFIACITLFPKSIFSGTDYVWGYPGGAEKWSYGIGGNSGAVLENSSSHEVIGIYKDGKFSPHPNDTLTIVNTVKIKGDIEVNFEGTDSTKQEYLSITVGDGTDNSLSSNHVNIQAYADESSDSTSHAQLVFNPSHNKTIIVHILNNLNCLSADSVLGGANVPLFVSFRGAGTTIFRLPCGRDITFGPETSSYHGAGGGSSVGTHVRILMDQSKQEVFTDKTNQVIFEKWSYGATSEFSDAQPWKDSVIKIGQNSSLMFLSPNAEGINEQWSDIDKDQEVDPGEVLTPGYGSIAFDSSNTGSGRMILLLDQGQTDTGLAMDFTDAGFNIYGSLVTGTIEDNSSIVKNEHLRTRYDEAGDQVGVSYNKHAGIQAVMRLTDTVAYNEVITSPGPGEPGYNESLYNSEVNIWKNRDTADRRGLLVINKNSSIPVLANNYDQVIHKGLSKWGIHNDYQNGFIIGSNGRLEINHNLFLDYIALGENREITSAHGDITSTHISSTVKKHNPAALYIDGYAVYNKRPEGELDTHGLGIWPEKYLGAHPEYNIHAQIILKGHAGLFLRSASVDNDNNTALSEFAPEGYFLGIGIYDGTRVKVTSVSTGKESSMISSDSDGAHALDVEGVLTVRAENGIDNEAPDGFITIPSLRINHAGQEVTYADFVRSDFTDVLVGPRPLDVGGYYPVYNKSSILLNDSISLFDTTIIHGDVLRDHGPGVLPDPTDASSPIIIGGELPILRGDIFPSVMHLYNSEIHCHESLVTAGVGFAVHELRSKTGFNADNLSYIVLYNRGRALDDPLGHGRVLQLGSQGNKMADGLTQHELLRDSYINIYRSKQTSGLEENQKNTIRLTIESAQGVVGSLPTLDKALQVIYLANDSQIGLGWPTSEADHEYAPWTLDDFVLAKLKYYDPRNVQDFRFNPYSTGPGELYIAGDNMYLGAGDEIDNSAPISPVPGIDVGGVCYVNHGGKLSIAPGKDFFLDTVVAQRISTLDGASGILDLPHDQIHYSGSGHVQPYPIDFTSEAEGDGTYGGHVLLDPTTDQVAVGTQTFTHTSDFSSKK